MACANTHPESRRFVSAAANSQVQAPALLAPGGVNVAVSRCSSQGGDACHERAWEWSSRSCSPMRDCAFDLRSIRMETIAELCLRGFELTRDEVDLLCRTDARLWFLGDEVRGEWQQ